MPARSRIAVMALLALALTIAGCSRGFELRVEGKGAALTGAQAERLAQTTDISALASVSATDAVAMRASVLSDLRGRGELGIRAAELLTAGFPKQTASVPVLVRASSVDGIDAVIVVEAYGSSGGMLVHRRLWVFDRAKGSVVRAASFR